MAHLMSFRRGWENENLARYILSRFSFIANPSTVSDDIGADYFCTIFKISEKDKHRYLIPTNSFAIQIKSNLDNIDFTNKIGYLANLELPFFVGAIDSTELKLSIYSGEFFPQFISLKTPNKLILQLCERKELNGTYYTEKENREFTLKFPKVIDIYTNSSSEELNSAIEIILDICTVAIKNISSRKNNEYIFYYYDEKRIQINAGKDSAKTFRENFIKRLAENFYNLSWIYQNKKTEFDFDEYAMYKRLYIEMKEKDLLVPDYVTEIFESLDSMIKSDSSKV
jgi:hypothetical protein